MSSVLSLSTTGWKPGIKAAGSRRSRAATRRIVSGVEQLLGTLPLIAWATDADLRLTWIEGDVARMLAVGRRATGAHVSEIFCCADQKLVERHRLALSGEPQSLEIKWLDRWYDIRIDALRDANGAIVGSLAVARDITELKGAERAIRWHESFDALTGTLNRRQLCEDLDSLLLRSRESMSELAVLYADVDGFSSINDTFGSAAADVILRQIAERVRAASPAQCPVARAGADAFAVVVPNAIKEEVERLCDDLHARFAEPFDAPEASIYVTVSIGAAYFPCDATSVDRLLSNAAAAARHAHDLGGNQSRYFSPALAVAQTERRQMEIDLRRALERDELFLMYQPQVRLSDGSLCGIEALLRWRKDGDVVPAWSFIRRAEESPLIVPIGEWVFESAMNQLAEWRNQGLNPGRLAVNVSARQLTDSSILTSIRNALQKYELAANTVEIEITETAAMQNIETTIRLIEELRAMGVEITIDDFGTGYSSLSYLQRFAITGLKIDRSFTAEIPQSATAAAIVDAIISTAHALGIRVVAEGVETAQQAAHLRAAGCGEAQGFLYARPLTSEAMTRYLMNARPRRGRRTSKTKQQHA